MSLRKKKPTPTGKPLTRYATWLLLLGFWLGSCALGCAPEVGPCEDPEGARETVLVNNGTTVQIAGQAIVNSACANGTCHTSTAQGPARSGAPAGLDFDLVPLDDDDARGAAKNKRGDEIAKLSARQVFGLRARQRKVLELRDSIWQQVQDGLMPPGGKFAAYGRLSSLFKSKKQDPCVRGKRFRSIDDPSSQRVLRGWLACGAPIVEINSSVVEKSAVRGVAGFQYPVCTAEGDESEEESELDDLEGVAVVSLETLLDGPLNACRSCHPSTSPPDLKTIMGAAEMVSSEAAACEGKPYISKGDPGGSFLYEVLSSKKPGCDVRPMPIGWQLPKSDLASVAAWIAAGAPLTDEELEVSDSALDDGASDDAEPSEEEPGHADTEMSDETTQSSLSAPRQRIA